jgi:Secretion system C-terminal sorting domain
MKKFFLLLFIISPFFAAAQAVTADPALDPMKITTPTSGAILVTELPLNGIIILKVPILNRNTTNSLPTGTCKVKINLGSKLILDPLFSLSNVNTSNFFSWTASSGDIVQITGDLTNELPANFNDTAYFRVKGTILGTSTITTNFLVTNHNTTINLSDENGANNIASIAYRIVNNALPVTFTNIATEKKDCDINVIFDIENEINVSKYELEVSNNLNTFEKISSIQANNLKRYILNFNATDAYQVPVLLVRIKSIDIDGKFQYSDTKKVSGICTSKAGLSLFPNPVSKSTTAVSIERKNGLFNGLYIVSIFDLSGKLVQTKEMKLFNIARFNYDIENISAGQYIIKIFKMNSNSIEILKFLKE